MGSNFALFTTVAVLILGFQIYVSVRVGLYDGHTAFQKIMQLLIVCLIPFFGAVVAYSFIIPDMAKSRERDTKFISDGGGNPPGITGPPP